MTPNVIFTFWLLYFMFVADPNGPPVIPDETTEKVINKPEPLIIPLSQKRKNDGKKI